MEELIQHCEKTKTRLIISVDSNAHHTLWGSKTSNRRGEDLVTYLFATNLRIINTGSEPTFVTSRAQTIIDLTLATEEATTLITDWHVSREASCSDHRWICYKLLTEIVPPPPRRIPRKTDRSGYTKSVVQRLKQGFHTDKPPDLAEIDSVVNRLTTTLVESYELNCPLTTPSSRPKPDNYWWGPELERLRVKTRKLFNRAMNTKNANDWDRFKKSRAQYKKRIQYRRRNSWKKFCTNIETASQTTKIKTILTKDQTNNLGTLRRDDGSHTNSDIETCKLLLETHFPGCIIDDETPWAHTAQLAPDNNDWQTAEQIVTLERVTWAINSFLPYKSAGLDCIFPGLLKWGVDTIAPILVSVYRSCLANRYIPKLWREVKVVFIPKPGKSDYTQPKSFRPISLTSFLLKTLERICDRELRDKTLLPKPLHPQQHAYNPGKSTDSALHNVVSRIEKSLHNKESTLGAFIDIEGAFDKTTFDSVKTALHNHGANKLICEWVSNLLRQRAVQVTVNSTTRAIVAKGCPQGGVLSPLLWNLVVNELIVELNSKGYYTVGYADDIAILINGLFVNTLGNLMQRALNITEKWCVNNGLSINPAKTALVLFTRKRQTNLSPIPKLFCTELTLTDEVKYLGVLLDSKLLWNKHLDNKINKASITFWQCKKAIGRTWGLSPKMTLWLYTTVIRPSLTYGSLVWWPRTELSTAKEKLQRFQRLACSAITGCMRTTPTKALEIILCLPPLDIYVVQEATMAALRLKTLGLWCNDMSSGHTNILESAIKYQPLLAAPCDRILKQHIFERNYKIQLSEEDNDHSGTHELRVYTDGSKTKSGTEAGVYSTDLNIKISTALDQNNSIFQCECAAIISAANAISARQLSDYSVRIVTDSQAVLRALCKNTIDSGLVRECHERLESVGMKCAITLQWIKGHSGSLGNDAADELARGGSGSTPVGPGPQIPIPFGQFRSWMRQRTTEQHISTWTNLSNCRQAKAALAQPDKRLARSLLRLKRSELRIIVGTLTGHCPTNRHLYLIGATNSPLCRACMKTEETAAHVILECEGVATQRAEILNSTRSLREACGRPRQVLRFWAELGWLET